MENTLPKYLKVNETFLSIQICTQASREDALMYANSRHASGTKRGWMVREDDKGVPCADFSGRTHYVFDC